MYYMRVYVCHIDWFWLPIFRTNLVRGPWNKAMKFQNKGAVLVQIAPKFIEVAPLCISQPHSQDQSIEEYTYVCHHEEYTGMSSSI